MGIGPSSRVIPCALKQTGIKQDDLDWIELNEAFVAPSARRHQGFGIESDKVNPLGGAIAPRSPAWRNRRGAIATLVNGLRRRKQKYGMVTMCIGTGMGAAGIFEAV